MSPSGLDPFVLFLELLTPRLAAARRALDLSDAEERDRTLTLALTPLAVDAALLGISGLDELARALLDSGWPGREIMDSALNTIEQAGRALTRADRSGARVDESLLREFAERLRSAGPAAKHAEPAERAHQGLETDQQWDPQLSSDLVAAFLDECAERLESLADRLLRLEREQHDRELVAEVFRDLHTLKGSSAFAGLRKLNRIAHTAEDRLSEVRDGRRQVDATLIDVLLQALDRMRTIVEQARTARIITVPIEDIVQRLADPSETKRAHEPRAHELTPIAPGSRSAPTTLRIESEKVDLLLTLVGEVVLSRSQLDAAVERQTGAVHELEQIRQRIDAPRSWSRSPGVRPPALDDLERGERLLRDGATELAAASAGLALAAGQLRDQVMKLRMVPIAKLFDKQRRTIRELGRELSKDVHAEVSGGDAELDKVLVEQLEDPLVHLVRNAIDHGIEPTPERIGAGKSATGTVALRAEQRAGRIVIRIEDDGRGMDPEVLRRKAVEKDLLTAEQAMALSDGEALRLIFRAGFSTAARVSEISGRGVGMDVVADTIRRLKGNVHVESTKGVGTRIELTLPLTLAITQVLLVRAGGELVAIPLDAVAAVQTSDAQAVELVGTRPCVRVGDALVPVFSLPALLGLSEVEPVGDAQTASTVIVYDGVERLALDVQQVLGRSEVVLKSLGPLLARMPCASGSVVIGDRIVLVLDVAALADLAKSAPRPSSPQPRPRLRAARPRVLVAEDSDWMRDRLRLELEQAGFEVNAVSDGRAALEAARRAVHAAVVSDVVMPGMDGYELVRQLRQEPAYTRVPILLVTSRDSPIDALRGYDAGADVYVAKPADPSQIVKALDELLSAAALDTSKP